MLWCFCSNFTFYAAIKRNGSGKAQQFGFIELQQITGAMYKTTDGKHEKNWFCDICCEIWFVMRILKKEREKKKDSEKEKKKMKLSEPNKDFSAQGTNFLHFIWEKFRLILGMKFQHSVAWKTDKRVTGQKDSVTLWGKGLQNVESLWSRFGS